MDKNIYTPEGFLDEEVRCGWRVTTKMKKVWAIEIAMLEEVRKICERHGLTYYAIAGTAIGAVRHKGFIPWDDDLDIAMKRDEYDRFITYAEKELEFPFFLQTPTNDKPFYHKNFVKIRHSLSTMTSLNDGCFPYNNGVFIDVFPLDCYDDIPSINAFCRLEKIRTVVAWNRIHCKYIKGFSGANVLRKIAWVLSPLILCGSVESYYIKHEEKCRKLSNPDMPKLGVVYGWMKPGVDHKRRAHDKDVFDGVIYEDFEYIKIPLPVGYDRMLRQEYGDYMEFPPVEERGKHHGFELDPDIPYKEYCSEHYGVVYDNKPGE